MKCTWISRLQNDVHYTRPKCLKMHLYITGTIFIIWIVLKAPCTVYDWWLSWQRLHSLNDSLQITLYCLIDTCFVTCSLWICHNESLYIYRINDAWILNLGLVEMYYTVKGFQNLGIKFRDFVSRCYFRYVKYNVLMKTPLMNTRRILFY